METTLHLPDDLAREIELRALHQGRQMDDVVTELLRKGLSNGEAALPPAVIT
jgi:plasmid stability protein